MFERVALPFAAGTEPAEVWVLDSSFYAATPSNGAWTSVDGRAWAQVTDSSELPRVYLTSGDSLYATAGVETGVVSHDGGRTWEAPTVQPGYLFGLFDSGSLTIDTFPWGHCVGVVWASAEGTDWQRVLNPWPMLEMGRPVVNGDTILIPSGECGWSADRLVDWIGTIG